MKNRDVEKPVKILFDEYNISTKNLTDIYVPRKIVAALAHVSHKHQEIIVSSLFGSRVDNNKEITKDSDIDFLIKLDDSQEDRWDEICYLIIKDLNKVLNKEEIDIIDISVFNGQHKDKTFKNTVKKQSFILKGNKKDL